MRALPVLLAAAGLVVHGHLAAQAPASAGLWRVPTTSLAVPAALQGGEAGAFWNPAASAGPHGIGLGVHAVHTGSTLGLSAVLGAGSVAIGGPLRAGIVLGRVQIRDLVRTTTSPDSRDGSIPVYEQFAGATLAGRLGPVQLGTQLQLHESRFDAESETGFVLDFGVRSRPIDRLELAASTHLLPVGRHARVEIRALAVDVGVAKGVDGHASAAGPGRRVVLEAGPSGRHGLQAIGRPGG